MPTNLTKEYNQLLDLLYNNEQANLHSIRKVYDRDFCNGITIRYKNKPIIPTPAEGEDVMDRMFRHLTTVVTDKTTKKREFESERSVRIHWIKHHFDGRCPFVAFKVEDENRVYLLNKAEKYVVILEPQRNESALYLLTAYRLQSGSYRKIMQKYERRGSDL